MIIWEKISLTDIKTRLKDIQQKKFDLIDDCRKIGGKEWKISEKE